MTTLAALRDADALVLGAPDAPVLDTAAEHHLRRVLRLRDGAVVTVTDGAGTWRQCRLIGAVLEPDGDLRHEPRPEPAVTIAVAIPKGDRAEWMVQKCTEIGVDRIMLLCTERSVVRWEDDRAVRHLDRLRRISTTAAMQSRRVWLPELVGPSPLTSVPVGVVAEPGGRPLGAADTAVAIGPEGGWSPEELARADETVSLGPHILRVETAAVVATALLVAARGSR